MTDGEVRMIGTLLPNYIDQYNTATVEAKKKGRPGRPMKSMDAGNIIWKDNKKYFFITMTWMVLLVRNYCIVVAKRLLNV